MLFPKLEVVTDAPEVLAAGIVEPTFTKEPWGDPAEIESLLEASAGPEETP